MSERVEKLIKEFLAGKDRILFSLPGNEDFHTSKDGYEAYICPFNTAFSQSIRLNENVREERGCGSRELATSSSTDKSKYFEAVKEITQSHKSLGGGKTVLSRTFAGHTEIETLAEAIADYFDKNKNAFRAIFRPYSDQRLWIVATPELLLEWDGECYRTMSLAGTRGASDKGNSWDAKNIEEQKIVTDYIIRTLCASGLDAKIEKEENLRSCDVEHICTHIQATSHEPRKAKNGDIREFEKILDALSPTPAVCGYPKDLALENIKKHETHSRDFYAGYVMIKTPQNKMYAYVTLRCAAVNMSSGDFVIYAGGGITSHSDPQKEFEETGLKAAPLYQILTKQPLNR